MGTPRDAGSAPLRVVLIEDSVLLREGLIRLFDEAGYLTAGAWGDADDIVARVSGAMADVAILDVRLPPTFRDEGIRAALQLREALPRTGILVLSQYVEGVYARELLASGEGGVGYLLKDRVTSLEEFTDAVRRIHERGTVLDPLVVRGLLAARPDPLAALTPRERDVLELMAEGRSNASIAGRLFVGVGAVEKNISSIFAKLGLEESGTEHRRVLAVLAWLQRDSSADAEGRSEARAYSARCANRNQRSFSSDSAIWIAMSWLDRSTSSSPSIAVFTSPITASMSAMTARIMSSHCVKPAGTAVVVFAATAETRASIGRPSATIRSAARSAPS
ncbi:hypothetical protein GCM10009777_27140 [Microbacterium pumilum]|uniref:DNA-binding response regulator n=1 Tax=Microbacterium pumilum TaxID=344165 RepID=A0ABP5E5N2_9MICO